MEEVEEQNLVESDMRLERSSEVLGMAQLMDYREGKHCMGGGGGHAQMERPLVRGVKRTSQKTWRGRHEKPL